MATPLEMNTTELEGLLQDVYNLPNRSSDGSSEPDLVIGLNWRNTSTSRYPFTNNEDYRYNVEDVSVESGSVSAVVEKLQQNQHVKVVLKEVHVYNEYIWSKTVAEASQVFLTHSADYGTISYPDTPLIELGCVFFAWKDAYFMQQKSGQPCMFGITFDTTTGEVSSYCATKITCDGLV